MKKSGVLWCALLASVMAASPAIAQEDEVIPDLADGREPAQVMLLGVFHFHNPGADLAQFDGIDVLTPEHQEEIEDIADGLARFAPTRIAVEKSLTKRTRSTPSTRHISAANSSCRQTKSTSWVSGLERGSVTTGCIRSTIDWAWISMR